MQEFEKGRGSAQEQILIQAIFSPTVMHAKSLPLHGYSVKSLCRDERD